MLGTEIEARYLRALKANQDQYAREALEQVTDPTSFGYGTASGFYLGLMEAERIFNKCIGEEDDEK